MTHHRDPDGRRRPHGGSAQERRAMPGGGRGGRPRGATRERILDIALELFNDRGYDKTSLREIAEELGFTKAALYYHFPNKQDMLLALHMRLHELGREALEHLRSRDEGKESLAAWMELLDDFIDQVAANRELFLLHERNHAAFEELAASGRHRHDHDDLQDQLRRYLRSPAFTVEERVRMTSSFGAVFGTFMFAGDAFGKVSEEDLAEMLRATVRDIVGPTSAVTRGGSRRPARGGEARAPRR